MISTGTISNKRGQAKSPLLKLSPFEYRTTYCFCAQFRFILYMYKAKSNRDCSTAAETTHKNFFTKTTRVISTHGEFSPLRPLDEMETEYLRHSTHQQVERLLNHLEALFRRQLFRRHVVLAVCAAAIVNRHLVGVMKFRER